MNRTKSSFYKTNISKHLRHTKSSKSVQYEMQSKYSVFIYFTTILSFKTKKCSFFLSAKENTSFKFNAKKKRKELQLLENERF